VFISIFVIPFLFWVCFWAGVYRGPQRPDSFLFLVLLFQPIERHFFLEPWRRSGVIPRKLFVRTKYERKRFSLAASSRAPPHPDWLAICGGL